MRVLIVILIIGFSNKLTALAQNESKEIEVHCTETTIENAVFEIDIYCKRFDKILMPDLQNFEILQVVEQGFGSLFPRTYKVSYNKAGSYTIAPIKVVLERSTDTIELRPITINVLSKQTISNHKINSVSQLAYIEKDDEIELDDFFIKLEIDKNKITTKDSILVKFLLYNSLENNLMVESISIMPPDVIQISEASEMKCKNIVKYKRRNYEVTLPYSGYLKFKETGIYNSSNFEIKGRIYLTLEDPLDLIFSDDKKTKVVTIPIECEKIKVYK
jgi:hypothetical protein